MKIALLAEFGAELTLEYLQEFFEKNLLLDCVIFIGDRYDDDRRKLVLERTRGVYEYVDFIELIKERLIACYFVDDVNSIWTQKALRELAPDLVVSGSTKIIRRPIWEIPRYGMLNCHSGIVQSYRGCSSVEWAIYNDDPVGSSCHLIDKGTAVRLTL